MTELLASLLIVLAGFGGLIEQPPLAERAGPPAPTAAVPAPASLPSAARPVPRILCQRPGSLELRRFEDRSAQVMCSGRVLARIAVPG